MNTKIDGIIEYHHTMNRFRFSPHELLKCDFDQLLDEGKRQEQIDHGNQGEYDLAFGIHEFYSNQIIPSILENECVFDGTARFVMDFSQVLFDTLSIIGKSTSETQNQLLTLKEEVTDSVVRLAIAEKANIGKHGLVKASDFVQWVHMDKLTISEKESVNDLRERLIDHERLQLTMTLRNIGDFYEVGLPRILFVVKRVIKIQLGIVDSSSDVKLLQPSDYIDWLSKKLSPDHPLFPVLVEPEIRELNKIARNVSQHHKGLSWNPGKNIIALQDENKTLEIPFVKIQKQHRALDYVTTYGVRAILYAFCFREQGEIANKVFKQYEKTFPKGFPSGNGRPINWY